MPAGARKGRRPASRRPEGTGTRKPAPGRDGSPQAGARIRDGPSRPRPWQAVAVAETAGSRGAGGPVERPSRGSHGPVTGGTRIRDGSQTPSRRRRELHASSRVVRHARRRGRPEVRNPDERSTADPRAQARSSLGPSTGRKVDRMLSGPRRRPRERHKAGERVTFPASSSPIGPRCGITRTQSSRKSDLLPSLCRLRHGSPTFPRPCDASPTEASRPGRLMGVTACQDPHEAPGTPGTYLGRQQGPRALARPSQTHRPPPAPFRPPCRIGISPAQIMQEAPRADISSPGS